MDRSKVTQQLVKDNVLFEHAGRYFPSDNFKETGLSKFDTIRNMTSSEHGVIVMGVAKSGSHLALSILDALGVDRAEELGVPGGVTPFPFEFQNTNEVYHRMEQMMAEAKRPIMLPHCHLIPELFIKNFKGKIVYISRDVRAVAASAYPFLNKLPPMKKMLEPYKFESIDEFAQSMIKGEFHMFDARKDDDEWVKAAERGDYENILMLKFEDIIADKKKWITKIGEFVGLTNYNMDEVIDQISVSNTAARRKAKFDAAGFPFFEAVCYRKGESKSWREELSAETLAMFKAKYPNLE